MLPMMLMREVGKKIVIRVGLTLLIIANSTTKPLPRPMSASQIDFRKWLKRRELEILIDWPFPWQYTLRRLYPVLSKWDQQILNVWTYLCCPPPGRKHRNLKFPILFLPLFPSSRAGNQMDNLPCYRYIWTQLGTFLSFSIGLISRQNTGSVCSQ